MSSKRGTYQSIADFFSGGFYGIAFSRMRCKAVGRGCDISIGTIVIISELINCIKRRTAIRKAH